MTFRCANNRHNATRTPGTTPSNLAVDNAGAGDSAADYADAGDNVDSADAGDKHTN